MDVGKTDPTLETPPCRSPRPQMPGTRTNDWRMPVFSAGVRVEVWSTGLLQIDTIPCQLAA